MNRRERQQLRTSSRNLIRVASDAYQAEAAKAQPSAFVLRESAKSVRNAYETLFQLDKHAQDFDHFNRWSIIAEQHRSNS